MLEELQSGRALPWKIQKRHIEAPRPVASYRKKARYSKKARRTRARRVTRCQDSTDKVVVNGLSIENIVKHI
jgi:hypothetical protein